MGALQETDDWLEIPDPSVDVADVKATIRERMAARGDVAYSQDTGEDPGKLADRLWKQMIEGGEEGGNLPIREGDCDVVPRNYVIDWRMPILGPIHALVRRVINAEIRRYVSSSLEKQSYLNRQILQMLSGLIEENKRLRQEIEDIQEGQG
jgi:hypothetical protein